VGSSVASVAVASPNDYVSTNNSADVTIQITASPPPPTPTPPGGTANASSNAGSGGGGGAIDLSVLGVLMGLVGLSARNRR